MLDPALQAHLDTGLTTLCRAWSILRTDGEHYGFTDHDCDIAFDGRQFRADTGLNAFAVQQSTGLSVDNTEALGALSDASMTETDILAGRFDNARVEAWLVNWEITAQRELVFRGSIGQITRLDGAFRAEVRGLAETLNQPRGRVIQRVSTELVDDTGAPFDLRQPGYVFSGAIQALDSPSAMLIDAPGFAEGWFKQGALRVLSGAASGLGGVVKRDTVTASGLRRIELWEPLRVASEVGDTIEVLAGFDGRFETARTKFDNAINFRGFPDVPEDDWVITAAPSARQKSGGSRR